jgi:ribose transport system ATP-binding protein
MTLLLSVRNLVLSPNSTPIDLDVHAGQVLGLAGLERAGQERFLKTLVGLQSPLAGTVTATTGGTATQITSFSTARRQHLAYLPRERRTEGILTGRSVLDNFSVLTRARRARFGFIDRAATITAYERHADRLRIKASSHQSSINTLSGGNQQKVLVARILEAGPRVLLLNDPTRGVDHRTRVALYELFLQVASEGTAVIALSSELSEIISFCPRALVFRGGEVAADLSGPEVTEDRLLSAMFGSNTDNIFLPRSKL